MTHRHPGARATALQPPPEPGSWASVDSPIERAAESPRPSILRVWWQTARPATLWAGVVPVLVGLGVAIGEDFWHSGGAIGALAGAVLLQLGTNFVNDYADFEKGADTAARLGPARARQRGWLSARALLIASAVVFALATAVGVYLIRLGGWPIAAIGGGGIAAAILYTAGPKPLGYLGLGDVFVMGFFGFAAVLGTHWLQTGAVSAAALWAAWPVGALATAILVVNNLRDRHTDVEAGKRTLAVRFGARFARLEYTVLVVSAYAVPALAIAAGHAPTTWLLPWLTAPMAWRTARAVWRSDGAALNPLLGATARLELAFGVLLAAGAAYS